MTQQITLTIDTEEPIDWLPTTYTLDEDRGVDRALLVCLRFGFFGAMLKASEEAIPTATEDTLAAVEHLLRANQEES
jgi:hypothetical protein